VRVKICGITTVDDALAAVEAGADGLGLNFVGGPRCIKPASAEAIFRALPPFVTPVALVRLEGGYVPDELLELLGEYWVSHVQLYGDVTAESLASLLHDGFRPIPAVAVRDEHFVDDVNGWLCGDLASKPAGVVLDAFDAKRAGGTGQAFEWDWVRMARQEGRLADWPPIILAGGLNADNVAEAVRVVGPYGVDVSSGVEIEGSPGRKDREKMRRFVDQARGAADDSVGR